MTSMMEIAMGEIAAILKEGEEWGMRLSISYYSGDPHYYSWGKDLWTCTIEGGKGGEGTGKIEGWTEKYFCSRSRLDEALMMLAMEVRKRGFPPAEQKIFRAEDVEPVKGEGEDHRYSHLLGRRVESREELIKELKKLEDLDRDLRRLDEDIRKKEEQGIDVDDKTRDELYDEVVMRAMRELTEELKRGLSL